MSRKPTYEELEQKVRDLEEESRKGKLSSEALSESHRIVQSVLHAVPDLLIVMDKEYRIKFTNAKGHDLVVQPDAKKQETCYGRFKLLDKPCEDCSALPVFETGCIVEREMVNFADGRTREVRAFPIFDSLGRVALVCEHVRDIENRKRAEDTLRKSEERFSAIFSQSLAGIEIYDASGRLTDINPAGLEIFGIQSADAVRGFDLFSDPNVPPDARSRLERGEAVKYETTFDFELVRQRALYSTTRSGQCFLNCLITPLRAPDHSIMGYLVHVQDVSERRRMEEALRGSQQLFSTIFRANPAAVILSYLADGKCVDANNAFARLCGYEREEIIGKTSLELNIWISYEDRQRVVAELVEKGHLENVELTLRRKSGELIDTIAGGEVITLDGQRYILSFFFDITELRRAEEELRRSENRFRFLAENSRDMIYRMSLPDAHYEYISPASVEMIGYTPSEIYDSPMLIRKVIHPDWQKYFGEEWAKLLHGNMPPSYEYQIIHKSGDTRWLYQRNTLVRDDNGNPIAIEAVVTDITERKRAEEALQESEERYRNLVEGSFDGIFIHKGPKIIFANQRLCEMLAYNKGELEGMDHWLVCHPDYRGLTQQRAGARTRGEDILPQYEIRLLRKDGSSFDGEIHARRIMFGDEPGIQVWVRDITERKRAEEALRESEALFRNLFEHHAAVKLIIDPDSGKIIDANAAAAAFYGWTQEELLQMKIQDINTLSPEEIREEMEKARTHERIHFEFRHRRADGSIRDVDVFSSKIEAKGKDLLHSIVHDITERKRAEGALRESEEKYRNILESIAEGYYEVDLAGNLTFFNDSVCELLGYPRDELMGMNNRQYTDAQGAVEFYRGFNEVYRTGKPKKGFDAEIIRKDGTRRFVEASVTLMRDEEGSPTGFRGIVRDVTERKQGEEEKKKLEEQLHQAHKMEAIGTLAGGIAHDFNNLLMGIQGRASLMLADMDSSHPHFENLSGIEEHVRSAADLTKQLLGFARGGKYEVKVTDLNDLTDRSANLFARTKKEITIHRNFQPDLWTVDVDRRQVEQVLLNLFVNAWQAMPAGGEIYLETGNVVLDEGYVKPHGVKPGEYVKISVTDTGVGMDEQTKQRLFDPFFTTKGMGRGTGLGLASAYGIVKNHNGIITVYSEKGHGSTFNIYLPASGKGVSGEKEAPSEIVMGEGVILLVDDEEMILEIGRPLLEKLGYEVLEAGSGKEAIDLYCQNMDRIKMVILDMVMPQINGGETFDRLRAINPRVKVLLSSGYSINGQAQEIINRGCEGFIQKPFNLTELSQRLREILGKP